MNVQRVGSGGQNFIILQVFQRVGKAQDVPS